MATPIGSPVSWQNLTDGSFNGVTFHYALPSSTKPHGAMSEQITSARRLQVSERPGVDGGTVRDFGAKARQFVLEVIFFGDTWSADLKAFKKALNSGAAQKLILPTEPQAINAFFSEMNETAQVGDGNSKSFHVTWIEDNSQTQANALSSLSPTSATVLSSIMGGIQSVGSALSNNPFLQAVQTTNAALATTKSVVNAVLALQNGVQNQIQQLQANITGTIALVQQGIESIDSIFGASATSAAATANLVAAPVVDAVTGLPYQSALSTSSTPASTSIFTAPSTPSQVNIPIQNTNTPAGATSLINTLVSTLQGQHDDLINLCGTYTVDVQQEIVALVNSLNQYLPFIQAAPASYVQVLLPMSLAEVLFESQGTLEAFQATYQKNSWIDDVLVLPVGSVVTI